jgi:hypothetical protein
MSSGISVSFVLESEVEKALATDTLDKNRGSVLDSKAIKLMIYMLHSMSPNVLFSWVLIGWRS